MDFAALIADFANAADTDVAEVPSFGADGFPQV
jgi:hypothetical protein